MQKRKTGRKERWKEERMKGIEKSQERKVEKKICRKERQVGKKDGKNEGRMKGIKESQERRKERQERYAEKKDRQERNVTALASEIFQ